MDPEILAPGLFGERKDAAQIISGQRRMIKLTDVLVSPSQSVFAQDIGETVEENSVVGADGVVGDREFHRHRDEGERDDESRAQIASGVHPFQPSSFNAFRFGKGAFTANRRRPSAPHLQTD